jgi:hypothetical protein
VTLPAAARALGWALPCLAVLLASGAETRGRVLEARAGSDPAATEAAARWLPFDGRVRLARALGEGYERDPAARAAWDSLGAALGRRPRHAETLLAAGQAAAARGEGALASRLLAAAVRASWHDASVAIAAGRSRIDEAVDAARRAPAARERAAAAERAGKADEAMLARAEAERLEASAREALRDVERLAAILAPDAHGGGSMEDVVREARRLLADLGDAR